MLLFLTKLDIYRWDEMGKKLVGISKASLEDVIFVSFNYRLVRFALLADVHRADYSRQNTGFQVISTPE